MCASQKESDALHSWAVEAFPEAELDKGLFLRSGEPTPQPARLERLHARVMEEWEGGPFPVGVEGLLELRDALVVREREGVDIRVISRHGPRAHGRHVEVD